MRHGVVTSHLAIVAAVCSVIIGSSEATAQMSSGIIAHQYCQKYEWDSELLFCGLIFTGPASDPHNRDGWDPYVGDGVDPAWSPDGSRLAFAGHERPGIFVLNLADWSLSNPSTIGGAPAWSPDGSTLAFAAGELYVMEADGSNIVQLTNNVGFLGEPAWSADGSTIAFDCEIEAGDLDICSVRSDGTGLTRLTSLGAASGAAFSPDGLRIAFTMSDSYVAVMHTDGTGITVPSGGSEPAWSPDGTQIAFVVPFSGGCNADGFICVDFIFTMNANGTNARHAGSGHRPAWGVATGPAAWILTPIPTCNRFACSFDGSRSWSGDAEEIANYAWNFGDGTTGFGPAATHDYAAYGTYVVTLTVTDTAGATATRTTTVVIENTPPNASFTVACTNVTCAFDATRSSDDGTITSYSWHFGDAAGASERTPSHTYVSGGIYAVTLTVTDNIGATGTASTSILVTPIVVAPPSLHIADLDGESSTLRNTWTARATATVHDSSHLAVANVVVTGSWSDGGTAACTTNVDGRCTVTRLGIGKKTVSTSFTASSLVGASFVYTPEQNHDPEGDSNGTRITVGKP